VQEKYLRGVLGVDGETWWKSARGIGWEWKREREKFEDKMDGREECRILTECWGEKKKNKKKKEREVLPEERVCQWRSGKIETKRKSDECRAEWKGQRHRQARKKGDNERIKFNREYERCMTEKIRESLGRDNARERKMMARFGTRREKTGWKKRKECAECAMRRERQSSTCGMDANWERRREWSGDNYVNNEDEREIERGGKG
jgi:hypothetical protein